jgi:hypothetical protein
LLFATARRAHIRQLSAPPFATRQKDLASRHFEVKGNGACQGPASRLVARDFGGGMVSQAEHKGPGAEKRRPPCLRR